ncbi:hypothetical protein B0H13DRAFT_2369955 [Mycena leptocephala]|nr:hypothetical protein B0H13DRAFT_2369955 [Mycena leptocephala]
MLLVLEADRARVADLEERLDSYKYPVLTLPNEIVSEIFIHFLPAYPEYPPPAGLLSPTLLTHICRTWREIALSTATLWSAIGTSYDDDLSLKQQIQIFDLWLKRSRFCPLSLRIEAEMGVAKIFAVVVPHRARWEHLELEGLSPSHLPIIEGPMPLLRHLSLGLDEYPATDVLAFRDAPLLRTVVLSPDAASSVILPWAQLTSLALRGVYSREFFLVLQKTLNLVRCELEVCFDSDNHAPGPDITLPYLESLVISGRDGPVTDLLGTFIVPALRHLKIPEDFIGPNPIDSLTGFISKSNCQLEEVYITGLHSLPKQSYREAFPSIRMFSFDDEEESNDSDASESDVEDNFDSE